MCMAMKSWLEGVFLRWSEHFPPALMHWACAHFGMRSLFTGVSDEADFPVAACRRGCLDRAARAGTIDITVQIASIDFGHDEMNRHAVAPDIFDAARYPTATFKGRFTERSEEHTSELQSLMR